MRLDLLLVRRGLTRGRDSARRAITEGRVRVGGVTVTRASSDVDESADIALDATEDQYVSRGALKLIHALDAFGLDVTGMRALDLGASTGGFCEVLLARGVASVVAVDVGRDQLHPRIKADPRIRDVSPCHAKDLTRTQVTTDVDLLVADVSFIGLAKALIVPTGFVRQGGHLIGLVKPQFELGPAALGKGGVVTLSDAETIARLAAETVPALAALGWSVQEMVPCPVKGADGNQEYLLAAQRQDPPG